MSARASYTQADIRRAILALESVGKTVTGVEGLPGGGFKVLTAGNAEPVASVDPQDWRERLAKWRQSA